MERGKRQVRIGVVRAALDGGLQRRLDAHAQTLRERLGHADALAVTAQRIRLPEPRPGVVGLVVLQLFGARSGLQKQVVARAEKLQHHQPDNPGAWFW
ncbi:MAG: hypothetical protein EOO67_19340, partial [Microbacterium sp.]